MPEIFFFTPSLAIGDMKRRWTKDFTSMSIVLFTFKLSCLPGLGFSSFSIDLNWVSSIESDRSPVVYSVDILL